MERMPFHADLDSDVAYGSSRPIVSSDWQLRLPVLANGSVRLREMRRSDAPSLLAMLSTAEVSRFISPPPTTVEGYERFIEWAHRQRSAGDYACFAVTIE